MISGRKSVLYLAAVFGAAWLGLRFLLPLFSPFLLGAGLALAAEPMVCFLCRWTHLPRSVGAGLGVTMAFAFVAMVLLLLGAFLVRELGALAGVLPDLASGISLLQSRLLELSSHAPAGIRPMLEARVKGLFSGERHWWISWPGIFWGWQETSSATCLTVP